MINRRTVLKSGDQVALIACSDGVKEENKNKVRQLVSVLTSFGLNVVVANALYRKDDLHSSHPKERAKELNQFFENEKIKAIFDISGGDLANQILKYVDFDTISLHSKPFFGISDLSVILNSLFQRCKLQTYHYRTMNLISSHAERQKELFYKTLFLGSNELFDFQYTTLYGSGMSGVVIGGNIRCFLKLAGTGHIPSFVDKIIFLESLGGRGNRILSLLSQLDQLGCFEQIKGIILGTFSEVEEHHEFNLIEEYIVELTNHREIPIVKTNELGHGSHCKGIMIGEHIVL